MVGPCWRPQTGHRHACACALACDGSTETDYGYEEKEGCEEGQEEGLSPRGFEPVAVGRGSKPSVTAPMAEGFFEESLGILRAAKQRSSSVLVAFGGGKKSWCVLDMCTRIFDHVEAFHMYFLPGLKVVEDQLQIARDRYHVHIHQLPHWCQSYNMRDGAYMFPSWRLEDIEYLKRRDIYDVMIAKTGIPMIATGARRADSRSRKRNRSNISQHTDVCHPCVGWSKADILAYLDMHKIVHADSSGGSMTGVGLSGPEILWLHDKHPDDYARLLRCFPLAASVIWRRTFHGVGATKLEEKRGRRRGGG